MFNTTKKTSVEQHAAASWTVASMTNTTFQTALSDNLTNVQPSAPTPASGQLVFPTVLFTSVRA